MKKIDSDNSANIEMDYRTIRKAIAANLGNLMLDSIEKDIVITELKRKIKAINEKENKQ